MERCEDTYLPCIWLIAAPAGRLAAGLPRGGVGAAHRPL
jgi:hypothetical protein